MKLPNRKMYWNTRWSSELSSKAMLRNRFDKIMMVLHFNDNNEIRPRDDPLYNKCHKVQPLFDHFCIVFKNTVLPETFYLPFKGVHSMKCYLPKKPNKWDCKFWARAGISGYIYDFEVHGGLGSKGAPTGSTPPKACGVSDFVILRLTDDLGPNMHQLFFVNYIASLQLLIYLKESKKIWAMARLNSKCSRLCPIKSDSQMKKLGPGHIKEFIDSTKSIVITAWLDKKQVLTISNYIGERPVGECSRFDKNTTKKESKSSSLAHFPFTIILWVEWTKQICYYPSIIPNIDHINGTTK